MSLSLISTNKVLNAKGCFQRCRDIREGDLILGGDGKNRRVNKVQKHIASIDSMFAFSSRSWHSNNYLTADKYDVLSNQGFKAPALLLDKSDCVLLPNHLEWIMPKNTRDRFQHLVKHEWSDQTEYYVGYLIGAFFACGFKRRDEGGKPHIMIRTCMPDHAIRIQRMLQFLLTPKHAQLHRVKTFSTTVTVPDCLHSIFDGFEEGVTRHFHIPEGLLYQCPKYNNGIYDGIIDNYMAHVNDNTVGIFEYSLAAYLRCSAITTPYHEFGLNDYCNTEFATDIKETSLLVVDLGLENSGDEGVIVDGVVLRERI